MTLTLGNIRNNSRRYIDLLGYFYFSPNSNSLEGSSTSYGTTEGSTSSEELPEDNSSPSFNEYDSTDDCGGHEAGHDWASENDIDDPDYEDSYSESFNEGVCSYVEENY